MVLAIEIITVFVKALQTTLDLVRTAVQARFSVANERDDEKALDRQLGRLQRRIRPLSGIRLNSDAAQCALDSLELSLTGWREQLRTHMDKPVGTIRTIKKFFSRAFSKPSKLTKLQQDVMREVRDCLESVQGARPQTTVIGFRTPAYKNETVEPYAFTTLRHLLVAGSSKPPRILLLTGMLGTGKSTLSYLLARDLEDLEAGGVFNGGVYRIGITNEQHRQPLNAVAVHLQKDLLENLGWPAGDSDAIDPGQLRNRMNDVFRTHLRDRQHLIVLDGAPSWDLVEFMKCDDMRGVVLVTSEPNLNSTARVADIMNNAADWANVNVMGVQLVPCALARAKAEELMRRVIVTPQPLPLVKESILQLVLQECDGNLMEAAYLAQALNETMDTDAEWQHILSIATDARDVLNAYISLSIEAIRNSRRRAAATVFDLLGHVKAELPLTVPLVELLVKVFAPDLPSVQTGSLLRHLVHQSMLYEVKLPSGLHLFSAPRAVDNYLYASAPAIPDSASAVMCDDTMMQQRLQLATLLLVYGRKAAHDWALAMLHLPAVLPAVITPLAMLNSGLLAEPVSELGAISWQVGRLMAQAGGRSTALKLFLQARFYLPADADKAKEHEARVTESLAALRAWQR